jgi:hypothetical protein
VLHDAIQNVYDTKCALTPPSPPRPPDMPPPPTGAFVPSAPSPPPPPPPPAPYFVARSRDEERDYDPDCELVSYATCKGIVADYAAEHGTANVLRVSFSPCEGIDLDGGCFRGCSYGGQNGGLFHDLLPDMLAEFNSSNPRRCRLSELPYCACANQPVALHTFPPPPPTTYSENYHTYPAYAEGEHVLGGGGEGVFDAEQGQASALVKRMTNAHTIDLALRSSHRTLQCPGENDGEQVCARNCAAEHLTKLRAFTVTGAVIAPSAPPSVPHMAPPSPPPTPPYIPFTECQNTCTSVVDGDTKCRDGGKNSYLPTMCPYATQCAQCGFRENTEEIVSDNTCATASNGVCEDGGFGTETFFPDELYPSAGMTTNCGLGTDVDDCFRHGPRTTQEISTEAYQGLSNVSRPAPPPPEAQDPPSPPEEAAFFDGSLNTCRALFYPNPALANAWLFDCSGTEVTIAHKRAGTGGFKKQCATNQPDLAVDKCSDGGYDATSILWTNDYLSTSPESTHFACDYGTSLQDCNPRTRDATTDIHCVRNGGDAGGSCHDSCWVDTAGNVYHTDEQFDARVVSNGGTVVVDTRCHDGGPNSISNRCGFGTQVRLHD